MESWVRRLTRKKLSLLNKKKPLFQPLNFSIAEMTEMVSKHTNNLRYGFLHRIFFIVAKYAVVVLFHMFEHPTSIQQRERRGGLAAMAMGSCYHS